MRHTPARRFYACLWIAIPGAGLMDWLYILTDSTPHKLEALLTTLFLELLFFGLVPWLATRRGYRAVTGGLVAADAGRLDEPGATALGGALAALPRRGARTVAGAGLVYASILTVITAHTPAFDTWQVAYFGLSSALYYGLFLPVLVHVLASGHARRLRLDLFRRHGLALSPGSGRLARRIGLALGIVACFLLFVVWDMGAAGAFADLARHRLLLIDIFAGTLLGGLLLTATARGFAEPVRSLDEALDRVRAGDFSARAPVATDDELGAIATRFNQMAAGLEERERLREMFGRYVTREVAEAAAAGKIRVDGESRVVTVLFTDIAGYTALSEGMAPADVLRLLNAYFARVVACVQAHGGHVNKFIGDSVFAVFGAPLALPDHAARAVAAAVDIARLEETETAGRRLATRVGVNTGTVVLGNLGAEDRVEYTAIGDVVNTAARLEQHNKTFGTRVLVGAATRDACLAMPYGAAPAFRDMGDVELKGKQEIVRAFSPL